MCRPGRRLAGVPTTDPNRVELAVPAAWDVEAATGVPVGLMDQLASVFGRRDVAGLATAWTLADAADAGRERWRSGSCTRAWRAPWSKRVRGAARARRGRRVDVSPPCCGTPPPAQVADDPIARHVVSENARVVAAVEALGRGDGATLGALDGRQPRQPPGRLSGVDPRARRARRGAAGRGRIGVRLMGAGFGGCVVVVTAPDRRDGGARRRRDRYRAYRARASGLRRGRSTACGNCSA